MKLKIGNEQMDMLKFKNLGKTREKIINTSYTDQIKYNYKLNELVNIIHPKKIKVMVSKIIVENLETKTFVLKPVKGAMPNFKAGQYIVLDVFKNNHTYKRSYSITSSPKNLDSYQITVKKVRNGIVSNYLLNEVRVGMEFTIHGPFGEFTYNKLRDQKDVLALVGGSGITPIMSLARAINDQIEDFNLTIIYGENEAKELIFKKELDELASKNEKINVHYVLSDEISSVYETGLISKEMISKYEVGKYSYFVCGPIHFYHHLNEIFKELDIPNKFIRSDIYKENEVELHHIEHTLKVITNDEEILIPCYEDESLSQAMEEGNIKAPRRCLVGVCGYCRSKLIDGKIKTDETSVREADKDYNYIHPCVSYPLSDVTIKLAK